MAFTLLFTGAVAANAQVTYALGDVNGNGIIAAEDALLVLQFSVGKANLTEEQITAADTTGENAPSAKDALCILQKAVEMIRHFPVEITRYQFTPFSSKGNDYDNFWSLPYSAEDDYQPIVVCNSSEELKTALLNDYRYGELPSAALEKSLAQYPDEYFESNSLILIWLRKTNTSMRLRVTDVYVAKGELNLAWTVTDTATGGLSVTDHLYHLEIQGRLKNFASAYCTVTDIDLHKTETYSFTETFE